ncbi:hypothetical protein [Desulfosarcina cetonica]|uniref:hypothetical protein n=1 Tax=Desulfosarcina cetonica TaxID=90730 RepID=UPI000A84AE76|nr:hypothetical protein [Desulfosarcina cetonica]
MTPIPEKYAFETGVYRPPSEGGSNSLLVRLTRNCPWNRCGFCGMYKTETFQLRPVDEIKRDIDAMAALRDDLMALADEGLHQGAIRLIGKHPGLNYHPLRHVLSLAVVRRQNRIHPGRQQPDHENRSTG